MAGVYANKRPSIGPIHNYSLPHKNKYLTFKSTCIPF